MYQGHSGVLESKRINSEPSTHSQAAPEASASQDDTAKVSILLVEDENLVAEDMKDFLSRLGHRVVGIASQGVQAIYMAQELTPELILMDVGLKGEMDGIQAASVIQENAHTPVIFLTGFADQETLRRAVAAEPLAYLVKPIKEVELQCAIEVAVHKHRTELELRRREEALRRDAEILQSLTLIDELTGLQNRRGFYALAEQELKVARREHFLLALFFMDVNGLKQINDNGGHALGDQALREAGSVIRHTFRNSDILARLGGDEFAVVAHVTDESSITAIRERLRAHLNQVNAIPNRPFTLDMSVGAALVDAERGDDLDSLLARADAAMYEEKRSIANAR